MPVLDPIAVSRSACGVGLGEVPATRAAVLVHAGDFATMGETYRTFGVWVAHHAEPSGSASASGNAWRSGTRRMSLRCTPKSRGQSRPGEYAVRCFGSGVGVSGRTGGRAGNPFLEVAGA